MTIEHLLNKVWCADALDFMRELPDGCVQCVVTSPPYWGLRDYGIEGQLGMERTPEEYVGMMVEVFREVRRVLRDDGVLWLNLGDSYASNWGMGAKRKSSWWSTASEELEGKGWGTVETAIPPNSFKSSGPGLKVKDLIGIPWRVAFALQADGWYLRQDIIWHKPNPMPESVKDRCTKAHEYVFLLSKSQKYFYDVDAIKETAVGGCPGNKTHKGKTAYENGDTRMRTKVGLTEIGPVEIRNRRSVWTIPTAPFPQAHFATFPTKLVEPCILAGSRMKDVCFDPFGGSGTVACVASQLGRKWIICDLSEDYCAIARERIRIETSQMNMFHIEP